MGRPRKPTHLKLLTGEREDRINRNEPVPADASMDPPVDMPAAARAVWDRLAPDLIAKQVMTAWDLDMFVVFCDAVATYQECRVLMGKDYLVPGSVPNTLVKSPYMRIMRDCSDVIVRFGGRFGLTPSDRAGIELPGDSPRNRADRILD
jgi:P27 family predicted phage terminase small subunit